MWSSRRTVRRRNQAAASEEPGRRQHAGDGERHHAVGEQPRVSDLSGEPALILEKHHGVPERKRLAQARSREDRLPDRRGARHRLPVGRPDRRRHALRQREADEDVRKHSGPDPRDVDMEHNGSGDAVRAADRDRVDEFRTRRGRRHPFPALGFAPGHPSQDGPQTGPQRDEGVLRLLRLADRGREEDPSPDVEPRMDASDERLEARLLPPPALRVQLEAVRGQDLAETNEVGDHVGRVRLPRLEPFDPESGRKARRLRPERRRRKHHRVQGGGMLAADRTPGRQGLFGPVRGTGESRDEAQGPRPEPLVRPGGERPHAFQVGGGIRSLPERLEGIRDVGAAPLDRSVRRQEDPLPVVVPSALAVHDEGTAVDRLPAQNDRDARAEERIEARQVDGEFCDPRRGAFAGTIHLPRDLVDEVLLENEAGDLAEVLFLARHLTAERREAEQGEHEHLDQERHHDDGQDARLLRGVEERFQHRPVLAVTPRRRDG